VFWFELAMTGLPLREAAPAPERAAPRPAAPGVATLLYVEDNPANLTLVEQIIGFRSDMRLVSATSAERGLEIVAEDPPDVILMDINLPGMDGTEARRVLAADPRTAHIPVIALSANAMERDVRRAMAAGFFSYLTKPIDIATLNGALDLALGRTVD